MKRPPPTSGQNLAREMTEAAGVWANSLLPGGDDADQNLRTSSSLAGKTPSLSDEHIQKIRGCRRCSSQKAIGAGAVKLLDQLPPVEDRARDFLMIFIALKDYEPPPELERRDQVADLLKLTFPAYGRHGS